MYLCVCVCKYICLCVYIYVCVCVCVCVYVYWAAPCLSCSMLDLPSSLRHAGPSVASHKLLVAARVIQFPNLGSNRVPLHCEIGVFATGLPGKSVGLHLIIMKTQSYIQMHIQRPHPPLRNNESQNIDIFLIITPIKTED